MPTIIDTHTLHRCLLFINQRFNEHIPKDTKTPTLLSLRIELNQLFSKKGENSPFTSKTVPHIKLIKTKSFPKQYKLLLTFTSSDAVSLFTTQIQTLNNNNISIRDERIPFMNGTIGAIRTTDETSTVSEITAFIINNTPSDLN